MFYTVSVHMRDAYEQLDTDPEELWVWLYLGIVMSINKANVDQ